MNDERRDYTDGISGTLRNIFLEDTVVTASVVIGILGGGIMSLFPEVPHIIVSIFLGMGISSLVYRFLGGIRQDSSLTLTGIKLTGTVAVWIACALIINNELADQRVQKGTSMSKYLIVSVWEGLEGLAKDIAVNAGEDLKKIDPCEEDGEVKEGKFKIPLDMLQNEKYIVINQKSDTESEKPIATLEYDNKIPKIKVYIDED